MYIKLPRARALTNRRISRRLFATAAETAPQMT